MTAELEVVAAAILEDGLMLACRRAPGKAAAGRWEFPGGKVEVDEDPQTALRRELREELDIEIEVGELLDRSKTQVGGSSSTSQPTTRGSLAPSHIKAPIMTSSAGSPLTNSLASTGPRRICLRLRR